MKTGRYKNHFNRRTIGLILNILLSLLPVWVVAQQDVQFSQYVFTGMALNPAYAGYKEETNIHFLYRDQWTGLNGAPKTLTVSMDGVTENRKIGLGGEIIQDELGAQSSLSAIGVFSYRLKTGENSRLSFGLGAGIDQYKIDGSKLYTVDQETALGSIQASIIQPDFKFGVFYADQKFYAAFSANDLFSNFRSGDPAYLVIYRNRHYYLQGGALFNLSSDLRFKPSLIIKEDFQGPTNVDLNLFFLLSDKIWLGGSIRRGLKLFQNSRLQTDLVQNDAFSILAEFFLSDRLRLGYSFDYTTNRLRDVNNGTHEISLGYTLPHRKNPMLSPRYF